MDSPIRIPTKECIELYENIEKKKDLYSTGLHTQQLKLIILA